MPNEVETPDSRPKTSVEEAVAEMWRSTLQAQAQNPENHRAIYENVTLGKVRIAEALLRQMGLPDLRMLRESADEDQLFIAERDFPKLTQFLGRFAQHKG